MAVFFFGTLADRDLLRAVLGREIDDLTLEPARLPGFEVHRIADEEFPILAMVPAAEAPGVLVRGLTGEDRARIDFYEDFDYGFETHRVITAAGDEAAEVLIGTDAIEDSGLPWDMGHWARAQKRFSLACAEALMALYGVIPIDEVDAHWERIKAEVEARLAAEGTRDCA